MATVVLSFPDDVSLATAVAKRLGARIGRLAWRHFPDGESLVAIDEDIAGAKDAVKGKTEMDALVAYLQGLGTIIKSKR